LSALRQIATNFDNFWQKDGKEAKSMQGGLVENIKFVATRYQMLRLICTKIDFCFDFWLDPRPCWGSLQCSPEPLAGFKEAYFYGEKAGKGQDREGNGDFRPGLGK